MISNSTYAEVSEGVRSAIAMYTQALDDGRTDDVVATFCPDGSCEIPGMGTYRGHDALHDAYSKWEPKQPQRHLVLNTAVTEWSDTEATAISDVVFLLLGASGWSVQLVGRYRDTLHHDGDRDGDHDGGCWRFHHRAATFVTERSTQKETT